MKKNGQYVGVDEKYIPEDEKYVDESLLGSTDEIRDGVKSGINQVKDYISDKDNQEKMKKLGRKGLKIAKGVGIFYIGFFAFVFLIVITIIVISIVNMVKINNKADEIYNDARENINKVQEGIGSSEIEDKYTDVEIKMFNSTFETYSGTKSDFFVEKLLDKIVTNNKTEPDHIITVICGNEVTSLPDQIINIKHALEEDKEYEVSLDYDGDGFVYQVTITEL